MSAHVAHDVRVVASRASAPGIRHRGAKAQRHASSALLVVILLIACTIVSLIDLSMMAASLT